MEEEVEECTLSNPPKGRVMGTRILVTRTRIKPHSFLFSVDLKYGPHIYLGDLERPTKSSFRHQSECILGLPNSIPTTGGLWEQEY